MRLADEQVKEIKALATELWRTSCTHILNRRMVNMGDWDKQGPDVQSGFLSLARAAYAAVLKDLKEASLSRRFIVEPVQWSDFYVCDAIRARAREIGVEIDHATNNT